jgi:hypothetical protein
MTLKEKFSDVQDAYHDRSDECEKIADDFAINFANWYEFMLRQTDNLNERFAPKELIEMFKKQKGL